MKLTHLIDTDVFIDLQREFQPAVEWFNNLNMIGIGVPALVLLELVQDARNRAEAIASDKFVRNFPVVTTTESDFLWALDHYTDAALANGTGLVDILIAATAISYNATLYTFNTKHYRGIPELVIAQPYIK